MNNKINIFVILGISLGFLSAFSLQNEKEPIKAEAAVGNHTAPAATYYDEITATSGTELLGQIHDLITETHKTYTVYDDSGSSGYQKYTDLWYEGETPSSGYIREFYSGTKWANTWSANAGTYPGGYNREHVWPKSLSSNLWPDDGDCNRTGGGDMHHIRPSESRVNSTRSNQKYGEVSGGEIAYVKQGSNTTYAVGGYYANNVFEPIDSVKGDVARIILYVYTHYNTYSSSIFEGHATTNGSGGTYTNLPLTNVISASNDQAAVELMLSWHESDPVDFMEQKRNDQVAIYQGNRNPFIDHPEYVAAIWGDEPLDSETVSVTSVSLNKVSAEITEGENLQLTATVFPTNATNRSVTWKSNNTNVATVSSTGLVTAKAEGTATITVTTVDGNKTATCSIKVNAESDPDTGGEDTSTSKTLAATFEFGANGTESHYDGSSATTYSETNNGYTLDIQSESGMYKNARDLLGNSCIKLGTGSAVGSMEFGVPNDIASVVLHIGKYKDNTSIITINGTSHTLTKSSNSGQYDAIEVDTSSVKTISLATTASGQRAMLNTIEFYEATSTLESIVVTGQKTEFTVGDTFVFGGTVTANYSDESTADVTDDATFSGYDMSTAGTQTVTVTYEEISTTYTITVKAAPVEDDEETPIIGDTITASIVIKDYAKTNNWENGTQYSILPVDSNITATATGSRDTGKYYTSGNNWRFYQSDKGTLSFSAAEGCTISTITITYTVSNTGILTLNSTNIASGELVSVNASEVTFVVGNTGTVTNGQVKVTAIEVTYIITSAEKQAQMFVDTYMHMNDVSISNLTDTGACKGENGYYAKAKQAFIQISDEARKIVRNNYPDAYLRLQNWAVANGETIDIGDSGEIIVSQTNSILLRFANKNKIDIHSLIILFIVGVITLSLALYKLRKREN